MTMGTGRLALVLVGCCLSACGSTHYRAVSDTPVKIGRPYSVRGQTYVPMADPRFDQLGYASWYGNESGTITASGERFRPKGVSGANRTLPLPTYVEVTALDTGRTILVRINDRGPFQRGRLIDLSRGAAEQLGILKEGHAQVRVRRVDPPEKDRRRLRAGKPARERPTVSGRVLANLRAQFAAGQRSGLIGGP